MKTSNKTCILVDGSLRSAGLTFYTRSDKTIVRCAKKAENPSVVPWWTEGLSGWSIGELSTGCW
jgi:hypothetical protein